MTNDLTTILLQILSTQYVIIGLMIIIACFMVVMAIRLDAIQVIQKNNRLPQLFSLTVKAAKKLTPRFKNLGDVPTKPDVLPELEKAFAKMWLADYKSKPGYKDGVLSFSESIWLSSFRFIGGNRDDWTRLMGRWREERIVKQAIEGATHGKGTALIAARGEMGMVRKLGIIAGIIPHLEQNNPETDAVDGMKSE